MAPCIETARIALRPLEPADATALLGMWSDEEVTRFLPFDAPRDLAGARRLLNEQLLSRDAAWAICEGAGTELSGYIQVDGGDARDVGYALRRESWGAGSPARRWAPSSHGRAGRASGFSPRRTTSTTRAAGG